MGGYIGAKTGRISVATSASNISGDISATDTTPELTLKNTTETDADGGRSSKITFKGEQSGGEESTLAQIQASHDAAADDEKGDLIFKTNDGNDGASPTERVRIDSAGNVGIGTDTPQYLGHFVDGDVAIVDTDATNNAEKQSLLFGGASGEAANLSAITGYRGASASNGELLFKTNGGSGLTERMRIKDGNVGIGTTSPDSKLDIEAAHSQLRLTDSDDSKFVLASYSSGKYILRNNSTSTTANQFTLTEDGKFGLGTVTPATKVHLRHDVSGEDCVMRVENDNASSGANATIYLTAQGNNFSVVNYPDADSSNANRTDFKSTAGSSSFTFSPASDLAMKIDADGIITQPKQPAFLVGKNNADQNNIAVATNTLITFPHERFDLNSDFNTSTSTFTAPVTGKYCFSSLIRINTLDYVSGNYYFIELLTSNQSYRKIFNAYDTINRDSDYHTLDFTLLVDMDAGDTTQMRFYQKGGSAQSDIEGSENYTYFSGYLVA